MHRRTFLKYTGVAAAIVGATALGLEYLSTQNPSTVTTTASPTVTSQLTAVSSSASTESLQLASLQGRLFFDYNGNGVQDGEEPAVTGALVQLKDSAGSVIGQALTDSSGDYEIEGIRTGSYKLHVGTEHFSDKRFAHMCTSPSEFRAVTKDYDVSLVGTTLLNIGLMEGFLTSPFHKRESKLESYVDLDPTGGIRDWKGGKETYNGHGGTDFLADKGRDVLAAAPGTIVAAAGDWPSNPRWVNDEYFANGNFVIIDHGNGFRTSYHHLDSIAVEETRWNFFGTGPSVKRGDVIGRCGISGLAGDLKTPAALVAPPHLHLQVTLIGPKDTPRDPFRDLYYGKHGDSPWASSTSLWTVDNKTQYA